LRKSRKEKAQQKNKEELQAQAQEL